MAAIETNLKSVDMPAEPEDEAVYDVDHSSLFAAVLEGDTVREYHLSAGFIKGESTRDSLPVIHAVNLEANNVAYQALGGLVEVLGVKTDRDDYWTPAIAVYALRRTLHDVKTTRTGKVKQIDIVNDAAMLGIVTPRAIEDSD